MRYSLMISSEIFHLNYHRAIATIDSIIVHLKHSDNDSRRTISQQIRVN